MAAQQAPLSLGFSRQEHWSGLPFPSPMHESEVAQLCPTLCDPMDCSLPGSSIHGIFQAKVLAWGAIGRARDREVGPHIPGLRRFQSDGPARPMDRPDDAAPLGAGASLYGTGNNPNARSAAVDLGTPTAPFASPAP